MVIHAAIKSNSSEKPSAMQRRERKKNAMLVFGGKICVAVAKEKSITETARIQAKMRITKFQHNENIFTLLYKIHIRCNVARLFLTRPAYPFVCNISTLFFLFTNLRILYVRIINAARCAHITSFVDSFDLFFFFLRALCFYSCADAFSQRGYADMPS